MLIVQPVLQPSKQLIPEAFAGLSVRTPAILSSAGLFSRFAVYSLLIDYNSFLPDIPLFTVLEHQYVLFGSILCRSLTLYSLVVA